MSQKVAGKVSEWMGDEKPAYGFIDVDGVDKFVVFGLEDVKSEERSQVLKVGAKVTFVYEPGTYEQAADEVRLAA